MGQDALSYVLYTYALYTLYFYTLCTFILDTLCTLYHNKKSSWNIYNYIRINSLIFLFQLLNSAGLIYIRYWESKDVIKEINYMPSISMFLPIP